MLDDKDSLNEWVITHEIARCFLVIVDYIHTGNNENFILINEILSKLLLLAMESKLTLYWFLIRLLRIIFSTFEETHFGLFCHHCYQAEYHKRYIRLLSVFKPPVTEMWPSQKAALPLVLGANNGAVINLRTSAGKTRVAEVAMLQTLFLMIHQRFYI